MTRRNESEKDFLLKSTIRSVLWAQGYSTRLDVLLAYDKDIQGKNSVGKAGLTDLDVLGVRLDPGFRTHTTVADCKTTSGQVPERLFWLSGVGKFFGSDTNMLVRSQSLPDFVSPLARNLDIALVGPDDLSILSNTYVKPSGQILPQVWHDFFSPSLLGEALSRLSRLPSTLSDVERYRDSRYWMDEPYRRLQRVIIALQHMAKDGSSGSTYQLIFADFVWLYVIALWKALESLNASGFSKLEHELGIYINGNEVGMRNLIHMKKSLEALVRPMHEDINLPLLPSYFKNLLELIIRCARRPNAVTKMARRAEWLTIGQMVGNLGTPAWSFNDDDLISSKLLGDVAKFLVQESRLKSIFLDNYLDLLQDWKVGPYDSNTIDSANNSSEVSQKQKKEDITLSDIEVDQMIFSEVEKKADILPNIEKDEENLI